MGTDNNSRFLMVLVGLSLAVTALAIIGMVAITIMRPTTTTLPTITPVEALATRPASDAPPTGPRQLVGYPVIEFYHSITAAELDAMTTPVVLTGELVPVQK